MTTENTMTKTQATPVLHTPYVAPVRLSTDHLPLLNKDDLPRNMFWDVLGMALTLKRDHMSATEASFVAWLARRLPVTLIDAAGNIHVDTRTHVEHRTLFTAHTDTVHNSGGVNNVRVDGKFWRADTGAALGADDGSGCALLAHMIEAGVPGYFIFFRGEERGGVGSKWVTDEMPELFEGEFDRAVAFDRAGYYDIITHQAGGRCCSDEFAQGLADLLVLDDSWFMPCNTGVYTDTAEFTSLIPECTNISVGYKNQHGDREEQDVEFLWNLAKGVVSIDWDSLPTVRDPKKVEKYSRYSGYSSHYIGAEKDETDYWDYWDKMGADVKDGVYLGTKVDSVDEPDGLDNDDEADEYTLMSAIEAFRDRSDTQWLVDLIAEAVYADDPDAVMRYIRKDRITEARLKEAEEMLMDGWFSDQILIDLFRDVSDM